MDSPAAPLQVFRVIVRGRFQDLDDAARARLRDEAAHHDVVLAAFRPEGTLTYDAALDAFSYRFEVRARGQGAEEDARARATGAARADLAARRLGHGPLRAQATNMADVWRRRGAAPPGRP